jgi:hypothetical protein
MRMHLLIRQISGPHCLRLFLHSFPHPHPLLLLLLPQPLHGLL